MNHRLWFVMPGFIAALASATVRASSEIEVPFELARGQLLYEKYCSSCHGVELDGSDKGPPLVHAFYKPSHHGDESFYRAALKGTRQHHWNFGDMKPVEGMTPKKMDRIVPYVRFYQRQRKLY